MSSKGRAAAEGPSTAAAADGDIDAVLAELDMHSGGAVASHDGTAAASGCGAAASVGGGTRAASAANSGAQNVLAIARSNLDPQEEMKGIFGTSVATLERQLAAENGEDAGGPLRGQTQGARRRRRGRGVLEQFSSANLMLSQHPGRPYDGALDMERRGAAADGAARFVFVPNGAYRTATAHYEQAQASYDPNNVMMVLQQYPFHVESLLAMADLHAATDQVSDQLIQLASVLDVQLPMDVRVCLRAIDTWNQV